MVKRVVVELENAEHRELSELKGKKTWKQVLFEALGYTPKKPQKGESDE